MLAPGGEQLAQVQREIDIHAGLCHPSILPLLAYDIQLGSSPGPAGPPQPRSYRTNSSANLQLDHVAVDMEPSIAGACDATAYLLFPAYADGTLAEEVERLAQSTPGPKLTAQQVLGIFAQVGTRVKAGWRGGFCVMG